MYNVASSEFYAQYIFFFKSSDAFASMRYLAISVQPQSDANIKALHPSWNVKQTWNYFMSLLMSQQKNSFGNICTTFNHHQNLRYNIASSGFYAQ